MAKHGQPNIKGAELRACLQDQYGLHPITLEYLALGLDYDAGVYRVVDEQGSAYLLKAQSRPLYTPCYLIPAYLHKQGIASVVAPLPTKKKTLWARLGGWTVILYPFLEGATGWAGMADMQWKKTGAVFRRIHQTRPPAERFEGVRQETFDPTEYTHLVNMLEARVANPMPEDTTAESALCSFWLAHQALIRKGLTTLETLAATLRQHAGPYVICHADLHPGNLIRDLAGHIHVIDWDEVMLAPKERDFIFVQLPQIDGGAWLDTPPFFQGYGQTKIDWVALTYYLWERVIQDVIECARSVYFRNDWGEEAKRGAVELFEQVVDENNHIIRAAQTSETNIPA
ncbi:MAG TPA: aminoglycoside phosphotransferase family protein [Ktedonobacterales bacterium]|nr:aminoglycoside phosphotransferase family protein [Ktedonobacterales bacterium]